LTVVMSASLFLQISSLSLLSRQLHSPRHQSFSSFSFRIVFFIISRRIFSSSRHWHFHISQPSLSHFSRLLNCTDYSHFSRFPSMFLKRLRRHFMVSFLSYRISLSSLHMLHLYHKHDRIYI
jgi:hypothetical protein